MTNKERRAKAKKVFDLLMASPELGTYRRPFVRSWRQKHCPKAEWDHLIETRTPEQIAKYLLHFLRTNRKSWAGQIRAASHTLVNAVKRTPIIKTNELRTENGVLIVLAEPDTDGKILLIKKKEG